MNESHVFTPSIHNPTVASSEDPKMAHKTERMRHLAAIVIQNAYKNALVNPNCQLGLNKIERYMPFTVD